MTAFPVLPSETLREAVPHSERPPGAQPATASSSRPDEAVAGQGGAAFPDELVPLAASIVADLRSEASFDGLVDLIARAKEERDECDARKPPTATEIVASMMLDTLIPLQIDLEGVIQRQAEKAALAQAEELDREFAEMAEEVSPEEVAAEFVLRPAYERAALMWAQARAIVGANSLLRVAGADS